MLGGQGISILWLFKLSIAPLVVSLMTRYLERFLQHRLFTRLGIDRETREAIAMHSCELRRNWPYSIAYGRPALVLENQPEINELILPLV